MTTTRADRATRPVVSLPVLVGGLLLAHLPTYLPTLARLVGVEIPLPGPSRVIVWNWLAVTALLLYVVRVERLDLASLRLVRPTEQDLSWAGYLGGAALAWQWVVSLLLPPDAQAAGAEGEIVRLGVGLSLALVVTVAITEEVLWRGYVVERLGARVDPRLAAAVGLAVFALPHVVHFGPTWLVTGLPGAAVLYALLLWRRSLWACVLCHAILDIPVVVLAVVQA
ncbi:type II CAAX endopeptidase family protein [Janibacter melonis]|uniref:CPBP family intramembrane glutamic endopeptidase n=1 Tax=Janibacter melonis TaxID=262209 RepID=UPI001786C048